VNINQNPEQAEFSALVAIVRGAELAAAGRMSVNFQNCRLISRIVVARNRAAERATAADFFPEIIAVSVLPANRV
jgi:hypothetical protein